MTKQELFDEKTVLEQEQAEIEAGGKFPSLLRSKEHALAQYQDRINALDQKIKDAERQEEKYIVWRTVSETVTAEQLQEILKNEVGAVQRDQQEA